MYLFIAGVYIRYTIQKMKERCTHNVAVHFCYCLYEIYRKWKSVVLTMYLFIAGVYIRYTIQKMKKRCTHNVSVHAGAYMRYCIQKMNECCTHNVSVHAGEYLYEIYRKWKSAVLTMYLFMLVSVWYIMKVQYCCTHMYLCSCWCLYDILYTENERALYS